MIASTATKTDLNIEYVWYASSERTKFGTLLRCYGIAKGEAFMLAKFPPRVTIQTTKKRIAKN